MAKRVPSSAVTAQCREIFRSWGMNPEHARVSAERLEYADLHGVDSHGIALLPLYARLRGEGHLNFQPQPRVVRETAVVGLIDGDRGLGQVAGTRAMLLAIEKACASGLAAVAVRNSNHFGAAGAYAMLAAEAGLVGMAFSAAWDPAIVPTHGAEPRFGTNPIAFAAPAGEAAPFCFDVATSTVAIGKLRVAELNARPLETGWALDSTGAVTTDPKAALASRLLTPLGGTPKLSSHKGYGLAALVEILSTMLSGASYSVTRDRTSNALDVGHFFIAIDPNAFRPDGGFEADVAAMTHVLRETRPAKAGEPVLSPGDPEARAFADRSMNGIPLPESLVRQVREIAESAKAAWLLESV
jgi:LDH2 family malate/lactate/ureidoglycolate dehydrogenase